MVFPKVSKTLPACCFIFHHIWVVLRHFQPVLGILTILGSFFFGFGALWILSDHGGLSKVT